MIMSNSEATTIDHKFSIVEATVSDLQDALNSHSLTAVDLLVKYLHRVSRYDCRGPFLNSLPLLSSDAFNAAAASDDRRAMNVSRGPFDGIPYTVKDSYRVKGMTVANGSHAFSGLVAGEDAFMVSRLRSAGAVLLGRSNMCPMAAGGMQRGVYGRSENPYNLEYLAAAFASGSSHGSGVSTGASLAAFGLGSETVSSGRSPASNNGLTAYNPSKGFLSIRGVWPLYPTCDTVTPHTRTMEDLLQLLDVIAEQDETKREDFWREQTFVDLPSPWAGRPESFSSLADGASLSGKRIAIPEMYICGKQIESDVPVTTSPEVIALWTQARKDLEAAGATIVTVAEFPVMHEYQKSNSGTLSQAASPVHLPRDWNSVERSTLIAHAWEDFLKSNNDPNLNSLIDIDPSQIWPVYDLTDPQMAYTEPLNLIQYSQLASLVRRDPSSTTDIITKSDSEIEKDSRSAIYSIPNLAQALEALDCMRKTYFESWMQDLNVDFVAFPAAGDIGRSDADINHESAEYAWRNGVKYSNGIRALRHLGIPGVTVTMGTMESKNVPVGLTFLGREGSDLELLKVGCAYETASRRRVPPALTPSLDTDWIECSGEKVDFKLPRVRLEISKCLGKRSEKNESEIEVQVVGRIKVPTSSDFTVAKAADATPILDIYVDGAKIPAHLVVMESTGKGTFDFSCRVLTPTPITQDKRNHVDAKIARDSTMVIVVARSGNNGRPTGTLRLIHQTGYVE